MVKSMTGYGRAVLTRDGRELTAEIRSVNNRYLDCSVKLPRTMSFAEDAVKQAVKSFISRGKVDVFVTMRSEGGEEGVVTLNRSLAAGYAQALRLLAQENGLAEEISLSMLASMPEVITIQRPTLDEEAAKAQVLAVVSEALAGFDAMRTREGKALEDDLRGRIGTILTLVGKVEERSPQTVSEYRARLYSKLQEVLAETAIDESRILTEAAIYADKVAVDEETVRLRSHLSQMEGMLSSGGAIGRKLDFLLQEMNREANTIGSKCCDVALSRVVVDIKAELEKIREQTQNIE